MMEGIISEGEEEQASKRSRVCECGRDAVEKVAGPRSANRGLRYLCCDRFVFFGKKKNYCRFFEWIDQPRISKEQKTEAQALMRKGKGAASDNRDLLQPARRTRSVVRDLEKQCETIEGLQVNTKDFELEIRVSEIDPPQIPVDKDVGDVLIDSHITSQHGLAAYNGADVFAENVSAAAQMTSSDGCLAVHLQSSPTNAVQPEIGRYDVGDALIDSHIASQHGLAAYNGADVFAKNVSAAAQTTSSDDCLAAHQHSSPTNAVQPKTCRCELNATLQQNKAVVQDAEGLNLSADDTIKGADTSITQIGPGLCEVTTDKDTNQEGIHCLETASEFWETPTCLCSRAAVLKTVKFKGPNQGLRFWVCSNSRPFYAKKKKSKASGGEESCKFFRWVDTPLEKSDTQKNEEKQKRKETQKRKELSLLS